MKHLSVDLQTYEDDGKEWELPASERASKLMLESFRESILTTYDAPQRFSQFAGWLKSPPCLLVITNLNVST